MRGDIEGFGHFSPKVPEIAVDFGCGSSYREPMSRSRRKQAHQQRRRLRTKAGEEITTELTETLASEAEQGYDLSKAKRCRVKESAPRSQDPIGAKLDAASYDDEGLTDGDLRRQGSAE
jgi:hypothetical protein